MQNRESHTLWLRNPKKELIMNTEFHEVIKNVKNIKNFTMIALYAYKHIYRLVQYIVK